MVFYMNLKEAFRYQNKLQALMAEADCILGCDLNVTQVKTTHLRKKVMAEVENETTIDSLDTEYSKQITALAGFMIYLLNTREALACCIRAAKSKLPLDMDSEVGLNAKRRSIAATLKYMAALRSCGELIQGGGIGYRFNAEGNQVSYRCDIERVTTINFDRKVICKYLAEMNRKADDISAELERCQVNTEVAFVPPFDINDSFSDVFAAYLAGPKQPGPHRLNVLDAA